jgi:protein-L-isoaspartate O-methyltransferase
VRRRARRDRTRQPVGSPEDQVLTVVERVGNEIRKEARGECKFVKLVGKYAWES